MTSRLLPTLFMLHAFVFALLAAFVYFIWREDREAREYRWWFAALLASSGGLVFFSIREYANFLSIAGGNALTLWGMGLVWAGVRVFVERPVNIAIVLAGGAIWIGGFLFCEPSVRIVGRAVIVAIYSFLLAHELASYQKERMLALRATTVITRAHGCFNAIVAISVPFLTIERSGSFFDTPLVEYLVLEGLSYSIVLSFALLALSQERTVARQKIAAATDPLTGLSNRRSFDHSVDSAIRNGKRGGASALLIFDLDCLKAINDRFGHSMGDQALKTFGDVAAKNIRAGDVLARVGGDEFAALLTHVDGVTAVAVAERIRSAYAAAASCLGDGLASVSVGIAMAGSEVTNLSEFKEAADKALYVAKEAGRNQVFVSSENLRPAAARLEPARIAEQAIQSVDACSVDPEQNMSGESGARRFDRAGDRQF